MENISATRLTADTPGNRAGASCFPFITVTGKDVSEAHHSEKLSLETSVHLQGFQRPSDWPDESGQRKTPHSECIDGSDAPQPSVGLLSLPSGAYMPPLMPLQTTPGFWQADGSFSCDWKALKTGEAFCSAVNASCAFCLSRAFGGPSALTSALLEKLRSGAKVAIEDEVARLVQAVKNDAARPSGKERSEQAEAAEKATQQLLKHPALQAVAFLSVHERRLAVFEVSS